MIVNKVVYGTNVLIDLTGDTVSASEVLNGKTFHDASGAENTGTAVLATATVDGENLILTDGFPIEV